MASILQRDERYANRTGTLYDPLTRNRNLGWSTSPINRHRDPEYPDRDRIRHVQRWMYESILEDERCVVPSPELGCEFYLLLL